MTRYDTDIARLAERRLGLLLPSELSELGLTRSQQWRLTTSGALRQLHRGRVLAYGVGVLSREQRILAASLAVPDGWVSGSSAGEHWTLRRAPRGRDELTVMTNGRPRLDGIRIRRTNFTEPDLVELPTGLRVSSPAQTLFELAAELDDHALLSAYEDGLNKRLLTPQIVAEVGDRMMQMGRPGTDRFRRVLLGRLPELPAVGSEDELVLLAALEASGLPPFERQYPLLLPNGQTIHLDGALPQICFGVEVDGEQHDTPTAIQRDKHRDLLAGSKNWSMARPTTADVRERLRSTVAWIHAAVVNRYALFGLTL